MQFNVYPAIGILAAVCLVCSAQAGQARATLYVAKDGRDAWSGRIAAPSESRTDGPFATLERARDEVRRMKKAGALPAGGVTVSVRGGLYEPPAAFELTAQDSGTEAAPVVYRAHEGEQVRISGGRRVSNFRPVADAAIAGRLDEQARGHVLQASLRSLGINDYGEVKEGGLEVFFRDRPMMLARWPNEGWMHIADVVGGKPNALHGIAGDEIGKFTYEGDRPRRWAGEKDTWVHGYWFWDWSDQRHKVESIDVERRVISVVPPYHVYGYRKGQWFYAFNLLSELDRPGEWQLDRETGTLYFWPPQQPSADDTVVSVLPTLVNLRQVSHVSLRGMTFEACRGNAVTIEGGASNQVVGCTLRNLGGWGVVVDGGTGHALVGCDIHETGDGGISLNGGDRKTLTAAGHRADNNHIYRYGRWHRMYQPAVSVGGVGNRVTHNLIHDAPHIGVLFSGNDHAIEFNEIHHVCMESNDAGAIYAGRDWTMRGTVIRHNFLHDINGFEGRGCVGVYLDDMFCGTVMYGNVFCRVTRAAFIGGGRDNTVENNIFADCEPALHVDARAMTWAGYHLDTTMKERLEAMPYQQPPWSLRYPQLLSLLADEPGAPKGNVVARNICWGGRWDEIEKLAEPMVHLEDNLLDQDPRFADAEHMDFRLRPDSPAGKIGFRPIPLERIGLYRDARRASWPASGGATTP